MPTRPLLLPLMFLVGLIPLSVNAQQSVNTTGGDVSNATGSVAYSIGQIAYSSYSDADGNISEGVQQPHEIYIITSIAELTDSELSLSVFPNPVEDKLRLTITGNEAYPLTGHQFQLLDITGKTIKAGGINEESTLIDMGDLLPGIYFLRVNANNQNIGHFKIIKR